MQACFQVFCMFSGTEGDLMFIPVLRYIYYVVSLYSYDQFFQLRWANKILYEVPFNAVVLENKICNDTDFLLYL